VKKVRWEGRVCVSVCARACACVVCVCMHGFKHVIKHDTCMHTFMMLKGEVKFPKVRILGL
jgi:hypothetical protein